MKQMSKEKSHKGIGSKFSYLLKKCRMRHPDPMLTLAITLTSYFTEILNFMKNVKVLVCEENDGGFQLLH